MSATAGPGAVGNRKTVPMNAIHKQEMAAHGMLNQPRLKGPGAKSLSPRKRAAIGIAYATQGTMSHFRVCCKYDA